jgi:Glycosyltransferase family 87
MLGGPLLIHYYNYDFLCYYIGGTLVREGNAANLYNPAVQMEVQKRVAPNTREPRPYVRPPWFALAMAPLTRLSLVWAYGVWIGVLLATLFAMWVWATLRFGESALLLAVLFLPANLGICFGQDSAAMLAVLCVSYMLIVRGREFGSGLALGLGLMKFHLLLLFPIWMLIERRWRMLAGFAITGAVFLTASLWAIGPSGLMAYADTILHGNTEFMGHSPDTMLNIYSVPANFGVEWKPLDAALAALVVGVALYGVRKAPLWRALAIVSAASLLISPHVFAYDATMLLLPIWLVIEHATRKVSRYAALLFAAPVAFFFTLAPLPLRCIPALALLAFLIAMVTDPTLNVRPDSVPDVRREIPRFAEPHPLV